MFTCSLIDHSESSGWWVCAPLPVLPAPGQLGQGAPELGGHEEVGEEVGGGVGEHQEVHGVAQGVVALLPEGHPVDGREHP